MGTKPVKTPKPTKPVRDPHPTVMRTPRPTKGDKTPRPTVWQPPKTTRNVTPKPTNTLRPTASYLTPEPSATYLTPEPTTSEPTKKPTMRPTTAEPTRKPTAKPTKFEGWGFEKPMEGCAENMRKKECNALKKCVWKSGYPPLAFSEDSDYTLVRDEDESFFANMNGSVVTMINEMDSNMLMVLGAMFAVILMFAARQCLVARGKKELYEPIVDECTGM